MTQTIRARRRKFFINLVFSRIQIRLEKDWMKNLDPGDWPAPDPIQFRFSANRRADPCSLAGPQALLAWCRDPDFLSERVNSSIWCPPAPWPGRATCPPTG